MITQNRDGGPKVGWTLRLLRQRPPRAFRQLKVNRLDKTEHLAGWQPHGTIDCFSGFKYTAYIPPYNGLFVCCWTWRLFGSSNYSKHSTRCHGTSRRVKYKRRRVFRKIESWTCNYYRTMGGIEEEYLCNCASHGAGSGRRALELRRGNGSRTGMVLGIEVQRWGEERLEYKIVGSVWF